MGAAADPPSVVLQQSAVAEEGALRERRRRLGVARLAQQHGALAHDIEAVPNVAAAEDEGARREVCSLQSIRQQLLLLL